VATVSVPLHQATQFRRTRDRESFLSSDVMHGWQEGYETVLRFAIENCIPTIVNGGDMLPKGGLILNEQKRFSRTYLRGILGRCRGAGIAYYAMVGDDDLAS
jgi:hypothetical protein